MSKRSRRRWFCARTKADAAEAQLTVARAEAAAARAQLSDDQALIAHLKLADRQAQPASGTVRGRSGPPALLDQLELQLEELEAVGDARTRSPPRWLRPRRRRSRPSPASGPSSAAVSRAPAARARGRSGARTPARAAAATRLSKLGEDVTETLEVIPRQWKVIQHVREKFTCRDCETISQAPAPFHVIAARLGRAQPPGHDPVREVRSAPAAEPPGRALRREGVPLSLSTLADQVGACTAALMPLFRRIEAHVLAAERLHGDDTTVPVLAKGKTDTGRLWVYVRDDGRSPGPRRRRRCSTTRAIAAGEHPRAHLAGWAGSCRPTPTAATASSMSPAAQPGPILEAACWVHARRPFFIWPTSPRTPAARPRGEKPAGHLADRAGGGAAHRRPVRDRAGHQRTGRRPAPAPCGQSSARHWSPTWRSGCASNAPSSRAATTWPRPWTTCFKRWTFIHPLPRRRPRLPHATTPPSAHCAAWPWARKAWLFCGSDRGGQRAAVMYSLIVTAKLNDVDPQAWLADVLARIADHPAQQIDELLPWNWRCGIPDQGHRGLMAGPPDSEKALITAACQRFIDEVLKPRFLPAIRPTEFNYPVDIQGKWHGQPISLHPALSIGVSREPRRGVRRPLRPPGLAQPRPLQHPVASAHRGLVLPAPRQIARPSPQADRNRRSPSSPIGASLAAVLTGWVPRAERDHR